MSPINKIKIIIDGDGSCLSEGYLKTLRELSALLLNTKGTMLNMFFVI